MNAAIFRASKFEALRDRHIRKTQLSGLLSQVLHSCSCGRQQCCTRPRPLRAILPRSSLTHRSAPISDHVGHDGREGAARGQALEQEAQEVEPVRDERVGNVELLQHVGEGVLEAVSGGRTHHVKISPHHVTIYDIFSLEGGG